MASMSPTLRHATLEQDGWELESGVARNRANPDSFWIPDENARSHLRVGHRVKLLFLLEDGDQPLSCERMWVTVLGRQDDDYVGVLENEPATKGVLASFTELLFQADHVVDIIAPDLELANLFRDRLRGRAGEPA